jgi:hypothetical protein
VRAACAFLGSGVAALLFSAAAPGVDFTLGLGPTHNCSGGGIGARAVALAYLEPAPVLLADEYGGRHYHPDDGDNIGMAHGYADVAAPLGSTCLGAFYRLDYLGEASRDALDAMVDNHSKRPFDVGRSYALAVDSRYVESAGLKLSRVFDFEPTAGWTMSAGVAGSLMKSLTYRDERLRGSAVATSGTYAVGTATFVRTLSDYNLKRFNPFVRKQDPEGYGWTADFDLILRSPGGHVLALTAIDAFSQIRWRDVPQSLESIDNDTVRYDANFNREAFITGRDRRVGVSDVIEPRYRMAMSISVEDRWALLVSDDLVQQTHFPAVGLNRADRDRYAEVSVDIRTWGLSLAGGYGGFTLSMTANSPEPQEASLLGFEIGYRRRW